MSFNEIANQWLEDPFDQETQNEVEKLKNDPKKTRRLFLQRSRIW